MTRAVETVRTHRRARLADEAIPAHLNPQTCLDHRVEWWIDDPDWDVILERKPACPCCSGDMPIGLLLALENLRTQ